METVGLMDQGAIATYACVPALAAPIASSLPPVVTRIQDFGATGAFQFRAVFSMRIDQSKTGSEDVSAAPVLLVRPPMNADGTIPPAFYELSLDFAGIRAARNGGLPLPPGVKDVDDWVLTIEATR